MTDWIHCNKCFTRYRSNIKFYITSCGHLQCQSCTAKTSTNNQCTVCNSACDVTTLSNNLKPEVQCYFRPLTECIEKTKQIVSFQANNNQSLLKAVTNKYNAAKFEVNKLYKSNQELKKEIVRLKMLLKSAVRGTSGTNLSATSMGQPSFMSPAEGQNITPVNNTAHNLLMQNNMHNQRIPNSWNSSGTTGRMTMHQQFPQFQDTNSFASQSELSYMVPQEQRSRPVFPVSGTPFVRNIRGITPTQNAAMIPMSHLRLDSLNKPR